MKGKIWLKVAIVIPTIFILLAGAVFAIFNGIIEIIEETLGNIIEFLANPVGFLSEAFRNLNNSWVDVTRIWRL